MRVHRNHSSVLTCEVLPSQLVGFSQLPRARTCTVINKKRLSDMRLLCPDLNQYYISAPAVANTGHSSAVVVNSATQIEHRAEDMNPVREESCIPALALRAR
jgi:hypothetical protein